jgi:4-alpha-glucanotransferase
MSAEMKIERSAGVLLHPTSLPSRFGVGDLGPEAIGYLDWLASAGVRWWQVLPLNPPGPGRSPYSALSTFAGNALLISPERLLEDGLLTPAQLDRYPRLPESHVAYEQVAASKGELLRAAWAGFCSDPPPALAAELERFVAVHAPWVDDFAAFEALKASYGGRSWLRWPEELRLRRGDAVARWAAEHRDDVAFSRFCQFLFLRQWRALKDAAVERGISLLGDVPIFVAADSAEVWAHRELFLLDDEGRPTAVAGVPPDYFSSTGQLWGNPLYDWNRHAADGYAWWIARLEHALGLLDAVRLDHFRGFAAHWQVPAGETTAARGVWVAGPGKALFEAVRRKLGRLPFVAEDLGTITEDVHELRRGLGLHGMAILQFAFAPEPRSTYIPYRLSRDLVVYTGTHDNNTTLGWYRDEASEEEKDLLRRYAVTDGAEINWDLARLALASVCDLAVLPHQDLAGVGSEGRMNTPGVGVGNWTFRLAPWMLDEAIRDRLAELIRVYGR